MSTPMLTAEHMDATELRLTVERARGHDPDAWEAIYRHMYPRLHAYARRRLGSAERADDAVSEAMLRAMGAIERFRWSRSDAGVEGWLFGIVRNVVLEAHRDRFAHGEALGPEALERLDEAEQPLERMLADEQAVSVRAAFGRLSSEEREVLELRVVGGLDSKGVASVLGKRAGAVRMAQKRALARLEGLLAEGGAL